MIELDGWETVYATGGLPFVPAPFIERDVRLAVERLRREERQSRPVDLPRPDFVSYRSFGFGSRR